MVTDEKMTLFKRGIANDLVNELVRAAPVDKGGLRKSIRAVVQGKGIFISMVDYALHVEFGTAPHIITPKNKQSLHWKWWQRCVRKARPSPRNTTTTIHP